MSDTTIVTVTLDGAPAEITIRKPTTGALRGLRLGPVLELDVSALIRLVPRISTPALTEDQVEALDVVEFTQLGAAVPGFFDPKRTG